MSWATSQQIDFSLDKTQKGNLFFIDDDDELFFYLNELLN